MKNRLLPLGLFALLTGIFLFLFSQATIAKGPSDNTGSRESIKGASAIDRLYQIRCNQVTGILDPRDMIRAREEVQKMGELQKGSSLNLQWIPLGPENAAGRVRALIFDNRNPDGLTLYAGGVTGGIWRSGNLGLTWHRMNVQSSEVLRVSCLVQTPSGVIYAGTGENYCGYGEFIGTGLYRSDDGENFTVIPSTQPLSNDTTSEWAYILQLACNSSGRLFAATNTGLKYSDDGDTWFNLISGYAQSVKVGPDGTVLAAVGDTAYMAPGGDIGQFVVLSDGSPTGLPNQNVGWIDFAIAPSDPNILYAGFADNVGQLLAIYRSGDMGVTWSVILPFNGQFEPFNRRGCYAMTLTVFPNDPNQILLGGANLWWGKQYLPTGYYNWEELSSGALSVLNPQFLPYYHHAYVFRPNVSTQFAIATDNGISTATISTEGMTFQQGIKNLAISQMNSVAFSGKMNAALSGGQFIGSQLIGAIPQNDPEYGQQIWIDNGSGTDGGSGGYCNWSLINPDIVIFSKQLTTADIAAQVPPFRRSEDLGTTVSPTFLGGNTNTAIQVIPSHLWESFNYENTRDSVMFYATDSTIQAGDRLMIESGNSKFPFEYIFPVTVPQGDSLAIPDPIQTRFFFCGTNGIYMTKDVLKFAMDPEWFIIALTPSTNPVSCLALSSDLNYLWAGTTTGMLYRISNIALAYNYATADVNSPTCIIATESFDLNDYPFLAGRYVTSVSIAPDDPEKVLVTLGNYGNSEYAFLTENGLDSLPSFQSVQGNLPAMPVYSSLIEMGNNNEVILGTDFGVFTTANISAATPVWEQDINGLGNVPVMMLRQQTNEGLYYHRMNNYGTIYLASYGRGIFMDTTYYMPLGIDPVANEKPAPNELKIHPNPARDGVTLTYELPTASSPVVFVYDLSGRMVSTTELGHQAKGQHSTTLDISRFSAGSYVIRLSTGSGNIFGKVLKMK